MFGILFINKHKLKKIMFDLSALTTALQDNATAVQNLVDAYKSAQTNTVDPATIQTLVDQVTTTNKLVTDTLTPPAA